MRRPYSLSPLRFTEADLRLFPTIARFDAVYATLFKCCRRRIADYPHLSAWAADVAQIAVPGGGLQVPVRRAGRQRAGARSCAGWGAAVWVWPACKLILWSR